MPSSTARKKKKDSAVAWKRDMAAVVWEADRPLAHGQLVLAVHVESMDSNKHVGDKQ